MKNIFLVILLTLFFIPVSVKADDDFMGQLEFGFWYAFWFPSSAALTTGKELDISIAPSLLKEVKFAMNFGEENENHFAVDYVADNFFKNYEIEAQKRVGEENTETMKQLMGLFRRQFGEYFLFEGLATFGSFKGKAGYKHDDLSNQELVDEMKKGETFIIDNRHFSTGDVFIWNTNFQIYDARLVLNLGESCGGVKFDGGSSAIAAGIKFMNYTAPINYNFKSETGTSAYTYTSNFTGTFFSLTFMNWPGLDDDEDKFRFMEGWSQIYIGRGTLKNDFIKPISVNGYGYDMGIKILIPVISDFVKGSIYIGARGVFQVFMGKEQTAITSSSGTSTGKADVIMSDYFFGPIAGVQIVF